MGTIRAEGDEIKQNGTMERVQGPNAKDIVPPVQPTGHLTSSPPISQGDTRMLEVLIHSIQRHLDWYLLCISDRHLV